MLDISCRRRQVQRTSGGGPLHASDAVGFDPLLVYEGVLHSIKRCFCRHVVKGVARDAQSYQL